MDEGDNDKFRLERVKILNIFYVCCYLHIAGWARICNHIHFPRIYLFMFRMSWYMKWSGTCQHHSSLLLTAAQDACQWKVIWRQMTSSSIWSVSIYICTRNHANPFPAELIYLNFQPLEVVSRYRDPQPQAVENNPYLFNLRPSIYKFWRLNSHFIPNNSEFFGK